MQKLIQRFYWQATEGLNAKLPAEGEDVLVVVRWPDDNQLHVDMAYFRLGIWHRSGYPGEILTPKGWAPLPKLDEFETPPATKKASRKLKK
jgi:hypothetical protein